MSPSNQSPRKNLILQRVSLHVPRNERLSDSQLLFKGFAPNLNFSRELPGTPTRPSGFNCHRPARPFPAVRVREHGAWRPAPAAAEFAVLGSDVTLVADVEIRQVDDAGAPRVPDGVFGVRTAVLGEIAIGDRAKIGAMGLVLQTVSPMTAIVGAAPAGPRP
jgi:hypothetical protein